MTYDLNCFDVESNPLFRVPKFSGNIKDWPEFWEEFEAYVDKNKDFPDSEKLRCLKEVLGERTMELVEKCGEEALDYTKVKYLLKQKFDKDASNFLLDKLEELPVASLKSLQETVQEIDKILRLLQVVGYDVNCTVIEKAVEAKIPSYIWNSINTKKKETVGWTVENLATELKRIVFKNEATVDGMNYEKAEALDNYQSSYIKKDRTASKERHETSGKQAYSHAELEARISEENSSTSSTRESGVSTGYIEVPTTEPQNLSSFCPGHHKSCDCTVYATRRKRLERAEQLKLCFTCLQKGHQETQCRTELKPCYYCDIKHNSAFHDLRGYKAASKSNNIEISPLEQTKKIESNFQTTRQSTPQPIDDRAASNRSETQLKESAYCCEPTEDFSRTSMRKQRKPCSFCEGNHESDLCSVYTTALDRKDRAQKLGLCEICLQRHSNRPCIRRLQPCRGCGSKHNAAFCSDYIHLIEDRGKTASFSSERSSSSQAHINEPAIAVTLAMCVEGTVCNPENKQKKEEVVILFDSKLRENFASKDLAEMLGVVGGSARQTEQTENLTPNAKATYSKRFAKIGIFRNDGDLEIITAKLTKEWNKEVQMVCLSEGEIEDNKHSSHLLKPAVWRKPQLYLGADCFCNFVDLKQHFSLKSGFVCYNTLLGIMLSGHGLIKKVEEAKRKT